MSASVPDRRARYEANTTAATLASITPTQQQHAAIYPMRRRTRRAVLPPRVLRGAAAGAPPSCLPGAETALRSGSFTFIPLPSFLGSLDAPARLRRAGNSSFPFETQYVFKRRILAFCRDCNELVMNVKAIPHNSESRIAPAGFLAG